MRKMYRFWLFVFAIVSIVSCKKQSDEFTPYKNSDFNDIEWSSKGMSDAKRDAMVKGFGNDVITANFDHSGITQGNLSNTTKINLPANAYLVNNVNYTGTVIAQLSELKTKGDFIRQLIPSCHTNSINLFKGAFNLNLYTSDNKSLVIKNQSNIDLYCFANSPYSAFGKYFYGTLNGNAFTWSEATPAIGDLESENIGLNNDRYDKIQTNMLGWMIDVKDTTFNNDANCTVLTPTNFTNKNTFVFMVLKKHNVVLLLNADANSKIFSAGNLPQDEPATFVALSYLDGKYYLGFEQTTLMKNMQVNIKTSLNPINLTDLNTFLDSL